MTAENKIITNVRFWPGLFAESHRLQCTHCSLFNSRKSLDQNRPSDYKFLLDGVLHARGDGYLTTEQPKREYPLLEQILSLSNLNAAYKQVKSNGGATGIDKKDCDRLLGYLREQGEHLTESIFCLNNS